MRTLNANELDAVSGGYINNAETIIRIGSTIITLISSLFGDEQEEVSEASATAANGATCTVKGKGAKKSSANGTTASCGG